MSNCPKINRIFFSDDQKMLSFKDSIGMCIFLALLDIVFDSNAFYSVNSPMGDNIENHASVSNCSVNIGNEERFDRDEFNEKFISNNDYKYKTYKVAFTWKLMNNLFTIYANAFNNNSINPKSMTKHYKDEVFPIIKSTFEDYNRRVNNTVFNQEDASCVDGKVKFYKKIDLYKVLNEITQKILETDYYKKIIEWKTLFPDKIDIYGRKDIIKINDKCYYDFYQPSEGFGNITEFFTTGKSSGNVTRDEKLALGIGLGLGIPLLIFLICYFSMSKGQVKRMTSMFGGKRRR
jgi:hypothetical protein